MKKFTLILLAACFVAATSMAQKGAQRVVKLPAAKTEQLKKFTSMKRQQPQQLHKSDLQQQRGKLTAKDVRAQFSTRKGLPKTAWQKAKAPLKADFIDQQPSGEYKIYERNGESYFASWYGVYYNPAVGKLCEVVFDGRSTVYLKNILSQVVLPGWIKGTRNGSQISFTLPQVVFSSEGDEYYVKVGRFDADESTYLATDEALTLNYDATTGAISSQSGDFETGDAVVGLFDDEDYWTGYADWNFTMSVVNDKPVEAPADLATEQFMVTADGFPGTIANVGFQGNDVYVQGIFPDMPEAWVMGTIQGDKAVFKSGQFLGADMANSFVQYLISATAEVTYVEDPDWGDYTETVYYVSTDDIVFDFDAATRTFTGTNLFMVNGGLKDVNYAAIYENAIIKPFVEVAATPMTPYDLNYEYFGYDLYTYGWGWGFFDFVIPCADEEGTYILPEKLSYQVWIRVNGEEKPLTLSAWDYYYLDDDMTEVPYTFTDNWDFGVSGISRSLYMFVVGPEAFGVQAIYRGAGEERRSEIAWVETYGPGADIQPDAATPDYPEIAPDNVGSSITYGTYTGDESRVSFGEWKPQTYDVAMKLQDDAVVGTYIEDVTFNLKTVRGLSNLKVWLSSQLRVENGENVPDLVSIDVNMPSRAGDVTVKLDKPYTIPAEGVYVGYSFTLSESAYSQANNPITVVDVVKPAGFYVHSTANILKWIDMSEMAGCSACINVTLGGSQVKTNAVSPVDGDKSYFLTGSDISVTLPFVNHGSAGVTSMDIEYTFNGANYSEHIDLDSPVKGFLGQTFDYTLNLPAISETGTYEVNVNVVKVNGEDNEDNVTATTPVFVINTMPKHRSLLEEYTGTWCGWCPRGFVALELLKEQYPDEFVCVSYHNADPMEITQYFPSDIVGFPSAWVDRGMEVAPFYGIADEGFGVLDVLQWRNTMFGIADIAVDAKLAEDESTVDVNCSVTFPFTDDAANYTLEYLLVEDGMTGEGSDWNQANYYAGQNYGDPEMAEFESGESTVSGLVFNDVVVMQSEMGGIYESVPTTVTAEVPVSHSYSFDLEWAVNTNWDPIIQDYSQLYVVALLIDNETGEVCNAIKVPVGTATVGIENVKTQNVGAQRVYDLMGRRVVTPQKGLYIVNGRKVVK